MMMNIGNFDELFRQIQRASSIENFMHMTQTKLFYPEIHIQHIKTIKFQKTNMRSRAKIFNEPNCFVLTNLKFFLKLFVQTRVPQGACIIYVTLDKCRVFPPKSYIVYKEI